MGSVIPSVPPLLEEGQQARAVLQLRLMRVLLPLSPPASFPESPPPVSLP